MANRKAAQIELENIISGRRLTRAISTGPKNEVAKLRQPAPEKENRRKNNKNKCSRLHRCISSFWYD